MLELNFLTPQQLYKASFMALSAAVLWTVMCGHFVQAFVSCLIYAFSTLLCSMNRWSPPQYELAPISGCMGFMLQFAMFDDFSKSFPYGPAGQVIACLALSSLTARAESRNEAYVLGSLFIGNVAITHMSIAQST
jgi:hypothetical protein